MRGDIMADSVMMFWLLGTLLIYLFWLARY